MRTILLLLLPAMVPVSFLRHRSLQLHLFPSTLLSGRIASVVAIAQVPVEGGGGGRGGGGGKLRPGMSCISPMSGISGLSFDSPFLSTLGLFCLVLLLFPSCYFSAEVLSPDLFPYKIPKHFS